MRIVFMGSPDYAAVILKAVAAAHEVVAVYTRPDAVRGRGKRLDTTPAKQAALELGLPVREAKSLRGDEHISFLRALAPDVVAVAAYGALLPKEVLDIPRYGCLNAHASLLPRWRGAAPVQRAILAGDEETGVCIMRMEEGLDTGDWCARVTTPVGDQNAHELTDTLAHLAAEAFVDVLGRLESGSLTWTRQPDEGMTYAHKVTKDEIDPSPCLNALQVERMVRAASDAAPAHVVVAGRDVILERVALVSDDERSSADGMEVGEARFVRKRLFLGCADAPISVSLLKPAGKRSMDAAAFAAGTPALRDPGARWRGTHD